MVSYVQEGKEQIETGRHSGARWNSANGMGEQQERRSTMTRGTPNIRGEPFYPTGRSVRTLSMNHLSRPFSAPCLSVAARKGALKARSP
jgi:hypothetical protein